MANTNLPPGPPKLFGQPAACRGGREGNPGQKPAFPYRTARCSAHMPTGSAAPWGCSLPSLPCHSSSHACGSTWETQKERVWVSSYILPVGTDFRGQSSLHAAHDSNVCPGLSVNHLLMMQVSWHLWESSLVSGAH